ncbi:ATP-dependent 6-phosphofructokinase [bacterium]|nr:MAG: ATP-dependent 6-phosphofructokinase [bacterium]
MKRVGIMTSGGDCSGLNAVLEGAVKAADRRGYEVVGFTRGWEGILSPADYRRLTVADVDGISAHGGTILKTTNKGRFGAKLGAGGVRAIPDEILAEARDNLVALGIDALIVIGGDGSLASALQLAELGVNIVGVPKTIDNDLSATDRTFGFSSAVQVAVEAIDRIRTTAASHDRVMLIETMGRHAGWIALRSGLAGLADAILLPEFPFRLVDFVEFLDEHQAKHGCTIVVVAEGAMVEDKLVAREEGQGEVRLGGISNRLMEDIEILAPGRFDLRGAVLGHVQRGGTPNPADRSLALAYGAAAIQAVERGDFNSMVAYQNLKMTTVSIAEAVGTLKNVTPNTLDYLTARELGVFIH